MSLQGGGHGGGETQLVTEVVRRVADSQPKPALLTARQIPSVQPRLQARHTSKATAEFGIRPNGCTVAVTRHEFGPGGASSYFTAAKRNHIDRILSEMDRRNTEIQDTLMAMKSMISGRRHPDKCGDKKVEEFYMIKNACEEIERYETERDFLSKPFDEPIRGLGERLREATRTALTEQDYSHLETLLCKLIKEGHFFQFFCGLLRISKLYVPCFRLLLDVLSTSLQL